MICEKCGKEHDGSYGSGRFCSQTCSRSFSSRQNREETNRKVSLKLTRRHIEFCKECGIGLDRRNSTGYCIHHLKKHFYAEHPEVCERFSKIQRELVAKGIHKGWKTRNLKSYSEKFFERVLDNNHIHYEREKKVGKYFLDFVIGTIDLEIDGKQHKYPERVKSDLERDKFLRSEGYFVYRIAWNEINSENGKEMMKEKIDLLLDFLKCE